MTHVPKQLWPKAFQEGKQIAEHVHRLNRELKAYTKASDDKPPTDRELALGACVMVFWAYKIQQEANAAARKMTIEKALRYIETEINGHVPPEMEKFRLRKALRRISKRTEGDGFLELWGRIERFLAVAQDPNYWKQEPFNEDPSTAIRALVHDLDRVASQGEAKNGEEDDNEGSEQEAGRAPSPEGDPAQADAPAVPGADGQGIET